MLYIFTPPPCFLFLTYVTYFCVSLNYCVEPEPNMSQGFSWDVLRAFILVRVLEPEGLELEPSSSWVYCSFSWGMLRAAALAEGLELELGLGWWVCWGSLGKPAWVSGAFLSAASLPAFRASKFTLTFKRGVLVSYSPLTLLVIGSTGFQNQLSGLFYRCQSPGLGCSNWGSNPSLFREDLLVFDMPFLFWVAHWGCGFWLLSPPPTHLSVAFSLYP